MTQRRIDPAQYIAAADAFNAISLSAERMLSDATSRLGQFSRMAGDDNGGENFAASYDPMVQQALQNLLAISQRANGFDRGFMASGANHASADAAAGGLPFDGGTYTLRPLKTGGSVSTPASSYGGDPSAEPTGWDVVRDFVGMMWPNADVGKLRQASGVWDTVSGDIRELSTDTRQADDTLNSENSQELPAARAEVNEFATDVSSVSSDISEIGDLCAEYADSVEEAHNEVIQMLVQLAVEIAAGIAIGAALSAFTFGIGGAATAGALALRIAAVATRIMQILTRLGGTAARIAARLIAIQARVALTANRFLRTSRVVVSVTSGTAASVTAEGIVQGRDANLLAAFGGGLAGGVVTAGIAAPFGRYGERVLVQMLSEGAGGAASGAADGLIRDGSVDVRQVVIQAVGGAALGGVSARSGSRRTAAVDAADPGAGNGATIGNGSTRTGSGRTGSVDAASPSNPGPRTSVGGDDGPRVPTPVGADVGSSSAAGASGARTDYDGPNVVGSDLTSGSADGGNVRVPDGEAPTAINIDVTSTGGADAPGVGSSSVDAPSASSVDLGTGSSSSAGTDLPSSSGVDAPAGSGVDAPTGTGVDAPTGNSDINSRFDDLQTRTDQAFDDLQTRTDQAFDDLQTKTDQAFDDLQADIDAKFDDISAGLDSDLDVHGPGGADADGPGAHAPGAGAGATAVTGGSIHSSIDGIGDDLGDINARADDLDATVDADIAHADADGDGVDSSIDADAADAGVSAEASDVPAGAQSAGDDMHLTVHGADSPDVHHMMIDSTGRDIQSVLDRSSLTPAQLEDYLRLNNPSGYESFVRTGQWPADVQVPSSQAVFDSNGKIDWPPAGGFTTDSAGDPIRTPFTPVAGDRFDRFGPEDGRYTSPLGENGAYSYDRRSLPYVEDAGQYHVYEYVDGVTDVRTAYEQSTDADLKRLIDVMMKKYGMSWDDAVFWRGDIASAFDQTGGGIQEQLPFAVEILKKLGIVREVF